MPPATENARGVNFYSRIWKKSKRGGGEGPRSPLARERERDERERGRLCRLLCADKGTDRVPVSTNAYRMLESTGIFHVKSGDKVFIVSASCSNVYYNTRVYSDRS